MKEQKINFYLPGLWTKGSLNRGIIFELQEHPEYFYDNVAIGAIYGTFPNCIWNGGRVITGYTTYEEINEIIKYYDFNNVPMRFTFTNTLLEKKHLLDTYSNLIMDLANNGKNEVLVNSKLLENYIREKWPNYKIISSTTKCLLSEEDFLEELNKDYYMVVLDFRKNFDNDFISTIEEKYKDKIEILLNAYCSTVCGKRKAHYDYLSKCQLSFISNTEPFCNDLKNDFYECLKNENTLKVEDMLNFSNHGFKNFKIEGRTNNTYDVLESYVYYMVKPEYKDRVRLDLLKML